MGNRLHARAGTLSVAACVFAATMLIASAAMAGTVGKTSGGNRAAVGLRSLSSALTVVSASTGVDSDIPGTRWPALDTANSATYNGDLAIDVADGYAERDVHAVYLAAGEVITASLDANGSATDYGLALFGPDAVSVEIDNPLTYVLPYHFGGPDTYPLNITSYTVPKTGMYYFEVFTWIDGTANGGAGDYTLGLTVEKVETQIEISPVSTIANQAQALIFGVVHSRVDAGVNGVVTLFASTDGYFQPIAQQTSTDGTYMFSVPPASQNTYYSVHYAGTGFYNPSTAITVVKTLAYLTNASGARNGARTYTLSGYVGSWHVAGVSGVRIYKWQWVKSKWKAAGYTNAKILYAGLLSKYSVKYKFPATGKWRLQAYHSDANHATTRSGYSYLTVK